ncbi:class I SAM-dependent methyltransferase [uncultured Marivirga sp.]|uniref:class I SAM-dependent methyltransferase n=1 Tax=uncultured Marivirga sp. TaxID=1123707 RepID=UPI0030ED35A6|tara:strand:+ start:117798 stop:118661 length:864 start_codon:yes stop_codon:yes gene_type:complete
MNRIRKELKKIKPLVALYRKLRNISGKKKQTYLDLKYKLEEKDRKSVANDSSLKKLHEQLDELKVAQLQSWNSFVYCEGYYYQGYKRIGIHGIKPTEPRMENYDIANYLSKDKTVLDIGSNAGWLACYLAEYSKEVEGIELNPYLVKMGEATAKFLNISNVNFIEGDFTKFEFENKYDIVFSLSNHFTIDGNLNIGFESYISKIFNVLNNGGILFFESHNIYGDDKDLDLKFEIASKYFKLVKFKMVKAFFPQDIDKLFAVFEKLDKPGSPVKTTFNLEKAQKQYHY